MKKQANVIGLIGGVSPESSMEYYELLVRLITQRCGEHETGKILLYSINFKEVVNALQQDDWHKMANLVGDAYRRLQQGGAELIAICSNTIHITLPYLKHKMTLPFIHIVTPIIDELKRLDIKKVGLLGTMQTMSHSFYETHLAQNQIELIVPENSDKKKLQCAIFDEFTQGEFNQSRKLVEQLCLNLAAKGAKAVILGCTELPLVMKDSGLDIILIDTLRLHVESLIDFAYSHATLR